ncbi:EAL domain-containing protein [Pseudokineococcus sp. 5B2Z-1]|uniref:EAL domain-containing protein n=1 Tax=Pseudokineococcus sp. 5B2Z-1 TaxID=3132744 RepID=UPI003098E2B5
MTAPLTGLGDDDDADGWSAAERAGVQRVLDRVRAHLGTEIAWVSEFTGASADGSTGGQGDGARGGPGGAAGGARQLLRAGSGDLPSMRVAVGGGTSLEGSFCVRVLSGALPPVVPDARRHPVARDLAVTEELGIGSYVGAPVRGADGTPVGMLCCLSRHPDPSLDAAAARVAALAADLVADVLASPEAVARRERARRDARITGVLERGALRTVFHPVVRVADRSAVGYEALTRVEDPAFPGPAHAFAAATAAGVGVELELLAARRALDHLDRVPPGAWTGVNLSAEALLDPRALELLLPLGHRRVAVELTEHTQVPDYDRLTAVTDRLRAARLLLVVDDAGAGYASLRHVLRLRPDVIKLDLEVVRGVDVDPVHRAMTRSMVGFAAEAGAALVAEGVETESEHAALAALGVGHAQGYLYGRPGRLPGDDEGCAVPPPRPAG